MTCSGTRETGLAQPAPLAAADAGRRASDLEILHDLVAIPSPTGSEAAAVRFLQACARRDGLRVVDDEAGNFVAEAGDGPALLLFVGHIDTVPGHIPVRVEDNTLWGRGSVDAKGPLAAAYCAARRHVGSKAITLRIVGAVDEEGNSRGAKSLPPCQPQWIIIGEPSGVHGLTLGYKGILRGAFTLVRPHHHGAHPGRTAVEEAISLWAQWSGSLAFADHFDAIQGHLTSLQTTSDGLHDIVEARFNVRIPPGKTVGEVEALLCAMAGERGAQVDIDERVSPALASKRNSLVAAFLPAIRARGGEVRLLRKTGTCDFNLMHVRYPGTPILAYGPGDARLDHTPDERIDLAEYLQAIEILDEVVATLAASGPQATPATQSP